MLSSASPSPSDRNPPRRPWFVAAMFVLLALLAFGPALNAPLDFDDGGAIIDNPTIQQLLPLKALFARQSSGVATAGRPVVNVSFAIDVAIDHALGLNTLDAPTPNSAVIAFHVTNLLIHLATALLLVSVIRSGLAALRCRRDRRWLSDDTFAILAGAIWLVHPIQTEAVVYVAQRTELLVSFFYVAALYAALRSWSIDTTANRRRAWIGLAVALSALGMASKEVMITAPLVIALFDYWVLGTSASVMWRDRSRRALYIGLVASMSICIALVVGGSRGHSAGFSGELQWWQYAYSQGWAIARYLRLMLWPYNLAFDYGAEPIQGLAPLPGLVIVALLVIATIALLLQPRRRALGFLGVWFFVILAPSSSVVPIHTEIAAERRVYLPFAAVVVALILGVEALRERWLAQSDARRERTIGIGSSIVVGAVLLVMTFASFMRSIDYRSLEGRWRDAVRVTPSNGRAYDNLASALLREEPPRINEADSVLQLAAKRDPKFSLAYYRRATIATSRNELALAESLLVKTLALEPGYAPAVDRLGRVYLATNRPREAVRYLGMIASTTPSGDAFTQLGLALLSARQLDSAVNVLRFAITLNPARVDTRQYLGATLLELNRGSEALSLMQETVRLDPQSAQSLALLSLSAAQAGQKTLARQAAGTASLAAPNDANVNVLAGRASQLIGLNDDAVDYFQRALHASPEDPQVLTRLAMAYDALGNTKSADDVYRQVLSRYPGFPLAVEAMQRRSRSGRPSPSR